MASLAHVLPCIVLLFFISIPTSSAQVTKPSKIVDTVCKQVSNYTFCVEAIYSDPHPVGADIVGLIEVTLSLAYDAVTATSRTITTLRNDPEIRKDKQLIKALLHCRANYKQADKYLLSAFGLKNSEVYSTLKESLTKVSVDASDCENGFKKIGKASALTQRNKRLEDICAICIVVANIVNS